MKFSKLGIGIVAAIASASLLVACAPADGGDPSTDPDRVPTLQDGKLIISTSNPAYPPYIVDNDPSNGKGFESAVAYAVAAKLGFTADQVEWVDANWDETLAPTAKTWDFGLQQVSINEERAKSIDFAGPYYSANQAVVTLSDSPAANATSLAQLAEVRLGAQAGTTSYRTIETIIKPTTQALAFNNNDDVKNALLNGQIDAFLIDLPSALYITAVEFDNGVILGQIEGTTDGDSDQWGIVLDKGSALTSYVQKAIDDLKADGTLDALVAQWLASDDVAPFLK
ncbi:MAG: amino acid ABC transporter substrate-binding protein [Microbacteriaceae bacterium]|nr:amino acid ABC transporter substrate-binding protein [Microbacteriaceae bacterium]